MSVLLERIRYELACDLEEIAARFKNPRMTLIVRSPDLEDGDIVISDDDLDTAIASIQKLRAAGRHS